MRTERKPRHPPYPEGVPTTPTAKPEKGRSAMNMHTTDFAANSPKSRGVKTLGRLLREAWAAYAENRPAYEKSCSEHNQRVYKSLKESPLPHSADLQDYLERAESLRTSRDECISQIDEETYEAVSELITKIETTPAHNLRDLAAMANACAIVNHDFWQQPANDLDYGPKLVRVLVEAVLQVAGERNVLDGLPLPQKVKQDALQRVREDE